ncbi:MAG: hypothetical protein ACLSE8_05885 [Parasutterella sp.]
MEETSGDGNDALKSVIAEAKGKPLRIRGSVLTIRIVITRAGCFAA